MNSLSTKILTTELLELSAPKRKPNLSMPNQDSIRAKVTFGLHAVNVLDTHQ